MIERKILEDKFMEYKVSQFVRKELKDVAIKMITFEKNPLGERVTIYTSTPGLVIGREGSNIKKLTQTLRNHFSFENPQIKIGEVNDVYLSASIVAKMIANDLSNFGSQKFKLTGFKALTGIMNAGAMGCEIKISGKLPSSRAKSWRFHKGYLKKTGYVSDFLVDKAQEMVTLKTGVVGIKVQIMLPNTPLPDRIVYATEAAPEKSAEDDKVEAIAKDEAPAEEPKKETKEEKVEKKAAEKSKKTVSKEAAAVEVEQ